MSRLYDTVEPAVINHEMLYGAVHDQGPKEYAAGIAKEEGLEFEDVKKLRLDFRNILKIDHLWQFNSLVKLQLDNNIIEKIEGLDTLVHLEWLDLSFNNIEVIEGLDKLVKLRDLTLYNNRIQKIENIEALKQLHVLSLGNNRIKELDQMIYLRQFEALRTLNMSGNPMCEDDDYKLFVIAFLPHLVYLDFRLVDADTRNRANTQYENRLGELKHHEGTKKKQQLKEEEEQRQFEVHQQAFVERLNGVHFFESMFVDDPEGKKFLSLPATHEEHEEFRRTFTEVSQTIFDMGLEVHFKRKEEVACFFECMEEAKQSNRAMAVKDVDEFLLYQKATFKDLMNTTDVKEQNKKKKNYTAKVQQLWDNLMGYEVQLVDQLEEIILSFEQTLSDFSAHFSEKCRENTAQWRELENIHHEALLEICIGVLERMVRNDPDLNLSEEMQKVFVDKDAMINSVAASHDVHLLQIDNKEEDMLTRNSSYVVNMMNKVNRTETARNRSRVEEISLFIDHLQEQCDNLELPESD